MPYEMPCLISCKFLFTREVIEFSMQKTVWYVPCVTMSVKMKLWLSGTIVKSLAKWINRYVEIHNYIDMALINTVY